MNDTSSHLTEPATGAQPVYDNRSLFSDYYLRERLSDHAAWSEDVTPAFQAARRLYLDKRDGCRPYDPDADLTPLVDLSEELAGVRERIAGTDTLIDRIVYRLYGLTAAEVAVVEGKGGG